MEERIYQERLGQLPVIPAEGYHRVYFQVEVTMDDVLSNRSIVGFDVERAARKKLEAKLKEFDKAGYWIDLRQFTRSGRHEVVDNRFTVVHIPSSTFYSFTFTTRMLTAGDIFTAQMESFIGRLDTSVVKDPYESELKAIELRLESLQYQISTGRR